VALCGLLAKELKMAAESTVLSNGVKLVSEVAVLPGSGLLLDGKVVSGLIHTGSALLASAIIGPIGWALVVADSYSQSVTGKHLWEHRGGAGSAASDSAADEKPSAARAHKS
jgi:hypothetical protein